MKVLVACGGGDLDDIAADLKRAGLPPHTQALMLSVADVLPLPPLPQGQGSPTGVRSRERIAQAVADAERTAKTSAARLAETFPSWKIDAESAADAPAWAILRRADEWKADLIVVGSRDRSTVARAVFGSVAQTVLWQANTSVRVARKPVGNSDVPVRMIVGIDGSASAARALAAVARRNWPPSTQVRLVTALDWTLAVMLRYQDTDKDENAAARRILEEAAATPRDAGLEVSTAVVEGEPKKVLLAEAEHASADCIFVGAQGLRGVERLLLGSVSAAIAARASCSVEVVRS